MRTYLRSTKQLVYTSYLLLLLLSGCVTPTPGQPTPTFAPPTATVKGATAERSTDNADTIAVLTYVQGAVFVDEPAAHTRSLGLMRPVAAEIQATAFQELREGSTVRAAPDAMATIVCYGDQAYQVTDGTQTVVNSTTCGSGLPLPPGSVPYVAPTRGRLIDNDGSVVIEGETREREADYGQLPIIVSPRNTALFALDPTIAWVDVSGALEYVLSLSGLASFADVTIAADAVDCVADERTAPNRICTAPWPADWQLDPDQRYFLTVSARTGIAAPLRESEVSSLRTLVATDLESVQATSAAIDALGLDPVTQNLLRAGRFREAGLAAQAIAAYEAAYIAQPTHEVAIALGDPYLDAELQRF
ncbi:MAG: hypothetical protein KDE58_43215, partial [Caldilineaceae bacterium]|nr:hypothetical protein [Caldilineaceae bacterium]